ncbi:hypothetical protein [Streptomyces lydicus]|uniref:hypothetical protein n=1 Tax=Streptomyces lydicus TaxID=47763 RepID=UPI003787E4AC
MAERLGHAAVRLRLRRAAAPERGREHQADPFHHEAAFLRCRPYGARGLLDGQEPLSAAPPHAPRARP